MSEPGGTAQWQVKGPKRKAATVGEDKPPAPVKDQQGHICALPQFKVHTSRKQNVATITWPQQCPPESSSRTLPSHPLPSEQVIRKPWSLTPGDFVNFIERVEVEAQRSKQVKSQFPSGQHCRSHSLDPSVACRVSRGKTDKMSETGQWSLDVH